MTRVLPLAEFLQIEAATFFFVLTRVSGIFLFAPVFSSPTMPRAVRFHLAFAIAVLFSLVVRPVQVESRTMVEMVVFLFTELLVGLILGTFLQLMFQALQLAGQNIGNQLGTSLANVINPQFDEQISTTAVVYVTVASLVFLVTGADREMLAALLETFEVIPLGAVSTADRTDRAVLVVFQESMVFAVRVSAPVTVALLLAEIAMGLVGRTVPQFNVQSIGFSIRILLGLVVLGASLLSAAVVFHEELGEALGAAYLAIGQLLPKPTPLPAP